MTYASFPAAEAAARQYLIDKPWLSHVGIFGPDDNGMFWFKPGERVSFENELFGPYSGGRSDEVVGV